MHNIQHKVVLVAVILLTYCSLMGYSPQQFSYNRDYLTLGVNGTRLTRIDSLLKHYIEEKGLPHAVTVVARKGEIIHHAAWGWRVPEDSIYLKKNDIFQMASLTKPVITVALMTLYEQGKFQLEDPVSAYIPETSDRILVKWKNRKNFSTREATTSLTISHLLSHTGGLVGWPATPGQVVPVYKSREEYIRDQLQAPLKYDPGTNWNYENISMEVAAYLIEHFSGQPLEQYLSKTILEPLGMTQTAFFLDPADQQRLPVVYEKKEGKIIPRNNQYPLNLFSQDHRYIPEATGLNGPIEDYARFCQMILNGGTFNGHRILGRKTIELMSQNQIPEGADVPQYSLFGLGFEISPGNRIFANSKILMPPMVSEGSLFWLGWLGTYFLIDPKEDLIILLFMNHRIEDLFDLWSRYVNTVDQSLE